MKKSYIVACVLALTACGFMAVFPSVALLSAQKGISLWASSVLPALLPFFICANFLNFMGVTAVLPPAAFAFSMSVMSGYPTGAKLIGDMGRRNYISLTEAKRLLSFCSTSGPAFIIGAVGAGMLGSATAGLIVGAAHYGGALLNGLLFSLFMGKKGQRREKARGSRQSGKPLTERKDLLELFTDAILASFKSLGIVLAYIVLFMFITDIVQFAGLFHAVEAPFAKGFLRGLFEMTVGCSSLAGCVDISLLWKCVLCTFLISFGGLSVIGQSMSMLSGLKISTMYFVFTKLCHGFLSAILAFLLASLML